MSSPAPSVAHLALSLLAVLTPIACQAPDGTVWTLAKSSVKQGSWKDSNGDWIHMSVDGAALVASPRSAHIHWDEGRGEVSGAGVAMTYVCKGVELDHQAGNVSADGGTIQWDNGSVWQFGHPEETLRGGRWDAGGGEVVALAVEGDRVRVTPIGAEAGRTWSSIEGTLSRGVVEAQTVHTDGSAAAAERGTVSADGRTLKWQRGGTWTWQE